MVIRDERPSDIHEITEITISAFRDHPYSNQTEQFIINALRAAKALTVSLVAEENERIVGHIAFSPVTISGKNCHWYGLGPVSVRPDCQQRGIGKALIREGLDRLRSLGGKGCILVGDPTYYRKIGFGNPQNLILEGVPPEYLLAFSLGETKVQGPVVFHEAFRAIE